MDTTKRRILYLGAFKEFWATENYILAALRNLGHEVTELEETATSAATIIEACKSGSFDLLLFAKGRCRETGGDFDGNAAGKLSSLITTVRRDGVQVCSWQFDLLAPEFCPERWQWAQTVAQACDVFATTDGYSAPKLPHAVVIRQGLPPDLDHQADWTTEYAGDVLFLGTAYRDRTELMDQLRARFGGRFAMVNNCRGRDLTALCRSYRIVVGPHYPSHPGYWSNRLYVVTGAGGLFACPTIAGMEQEGWRASTNYLALPDRPALMAAQLDEYLRWDAARLRAIQRAGYELAKTLTYEVRVQELLSALEAKRASASAAQNIDAEYSSDPDEPTEIE